MTSDVRSWGMVGRIKEFGDIERSGIGVWGRGGIGGEGLHPRKTKRRRTLIRNGVDQGLGEC